MTDLLELMNQDEDLESEIIEVTDADFEDDATVMSEDKAREVTDAIKAAATATHVLLARAHQGKAYKALGYKTWAEYVKTEFDGMSTQRSYQFLDQAKIIKEIESVVPEGTTVRLTEAQARDIKRELPFITSKIAEETENLDADEAETRVNEIIEEQREQKKLEDEAIALKEKNLAEAEEEGYRAGLEAGADALLEASGFDLSGEDDDSNDGWGEDSSSDNNDDGPGLSPQLAMDLHNLVNVLAGIMALPDARDLINVIPESKWADVKAQAQTASDWFQGFNDLAEDRD